MVASAILTVDIPIDPNERTVIFNGSSVIKQFF